MFFCRLNFFSRTWLFGCLPCSKRFWKIRLESKLLSLVERQFGQHGFTLASHFGLALPFWDLRWWKTQCAEAKCEKHFIESFQWKISGSNGTSKKVVLFFRSECSKRKFVFHFFNSKPSLIPVSGLRSRFPVNGTDSYKWQTRFPNEIYQSWISLSICPNCEPTGLPMKMVKNLWVDSNGKLDKQNCPLYAGVRRAVFHSSGERGEKGRRVREEQLYTELLTNKIP